MDVGRLGCGRRISLATKSKLDDRMDKKARVVKRPNVYFERNRHRRIDEEV